ncbi:MAG: TetR/AcrR family transcriptional regulator [bacterium]|nr:TetR/AcrR family transcriptional regulator [bacterium]MCP4964069.1 TetR/AcrR family transcriptional regulator [bacterium]
MGRKLGITLDDVVDAAATIADRDGLEAASLSAVADKLGIKTPSIYNHVAGLAGLRREMALHTATEISTVCETAVRDTAEPADALRQVSHAYRAFVKSHPGLYRTLTPAPKPGEDDELYEAMAAPVTVLLGVMARAGVAENQRIHSIRALRALWHGFVDLETSGGFGMPTDIDASFDAALEALIEGIMESAR